MSSSSSTITPIPDDSIKSINHVTPADAAAATSGRIVVAEGPA
jgi:hypothetical protein